MSYQDIVRGFLGCGWHSDEGASICLTTSESRRHAAFCSIDPFTTGLTELILTWSPRPPNAPSRRLPTARAMHKRMSHVLAPAYNRPNRFASPTRAPAST